MLLQDPKGDGKVKAMGKRVLAISDGKGFLLKEGKGGYALLSYFHSDLLYRANSVSLDLPGLGEVKITGAFERLPLPFGGIRFFNEDELNSPLIDPSDRLLLCLCFLFKPLLLGQNRVHPLSPDDEKGYRRLIRTLREKGMKRQNKEAIKELSRYECAYPRLEAASRLLGEKEDGQEAA